MTPTGRGVVRIAWLIGPALPPRDPQLPSAPEPLTGPAVLRHGQTLAALRLDGLDLAGQRARGVTIDETVLRTVDFSGSRLEQLSLTDVELSACEARRCELAQLRGADRLRGLSMPWPEIIANAGVWAGGLGIAAIEE